MKSISKVRIFIGAGFVFAFAVWTVLVRFVGVKEIGPLGTSVGFAELNGAFHSLTGVHMALYTVTDWLGIVPIVIALGYAVLGLWQWIKRKSILKVSPSVLALGAFYIAVIAVFVIFEAVELNYRPILIEGRLEASYPSSTTLLCACVVPAAIIDAKARIRNAAALRCTRFALAAFTAFMVIARSISGVHWLTDIIGGLLFSIGLVLIYSSFEWVE